MRRLGLVVVLVVGCGGASPSTSEVGGAGGQLGSGGAAGSSTGGNTGAIAGQGGAAGGAAAGSSGAAGAAGAAAGAAGQGQAGAGGAAGGAAGAAGGGAGAAGPSCGASPAPSTTCNSLAVDGPCVLPTFVVGSWPAGTFSSGTTPKAGTYQLTAVTYYGAAADAGAGFECEGTAPLRETLDVTSSYLQVAQAQTGIALAVRAGSMAFMSSGFSGPPSLPTSYTFAPSCASGAGTNTVEGGWGATSTTVTLSGFTLAGCMHGGKGRAGTEVDTFTLAP
jgi:hypothetical protein